MAPTEVSIRFFLALALIVATCRLAGSLFKWVGQPQVVSEMIAGVLLGPSLLGWLAPGVSAYLFPPELRAVLYVMCQLGLAIYMFLIGLEFDIELVRSRARSAVTVSLAGIVAPFALGGALAVFICDNTLLFGGGVTLLEASLFTGASMSITAFPMLARIIHEERLASTPLGTLALTAGSVDDAAAWCVLAVVLASFTGEASVAVLAIAGAALYALLTLTLGRRVLRLLAANVERQGHMTDGVLACVMGVVLLGAWFTDFVGVYAVFGAFIVGVAMPRGKLQSELQVRLGPLTTQLLLPTFFVYSGLNTRIGLLESPWLWMTAGLCLFVASLGKAGACYAAARLVGEPPREALGVCMLMNARGLMELIILNIGLERGVIRPAFFTVMVTMAIGTTVAATPLFRRFYLRRATIQQAAAVFSHVRNTMV